MKHTLSPQAQAAIDKIIERDKERSLELDIQAAIALDRPAAFARSLARLKKITRVDIDRWASKACEIDASKCLLHLLDLGLGAPSRTHAEKVDGGQWHHTMIMWAASSGSARCVKALAASGRYAPHLPNSQNYTALESAASNGHTRCAIAMLSLARFDDPRIRSAADWAVRHGHHALGKKLIDHLEQPCARAQATGAALEECFSSRDFHASGQQAGVRFWIAQMSKLSQRDSHARLAWANAIAKLHQERRLAPPWVVDLIGLTLTPQTFNATATSGSTPLIGAILSLDLYAASVYAPKSSTELRILTPKGTQSYLRLAMRQPSRPGDPSFQMARLLLSLAPPDAKELGACKRLARSLARQDASKRQHMELLDSFECSQLLDRATPATATPRARAAPRL